jgi:hypothetical protein
MVHIKFIALLQTPIISPKFYLMASDGGLEVSIERRETSTEQLEDSVVGQ